MEVLTMRESASSVSASSQEGWAPAHHTGRFSLPAPVTTLMPGICTLPPATLLEDGLCIPDANVLPARRLIVLVPIEDVDAFHLSRRVWQLAACSGLSVLYLALPLDEHPAVSLHRRLAELAALTSDKSVQARWMVGGAKSWRQALENVLQPGDLLVCLAGQRSAGWINRHLLLGEQMAKLLSLPVYLLGDVPLAVKQPPEWKKELLGWVTSIALIAGFFVLQVNIDRTALRPVSTLILCLSVVVEIYLLGKVNEWIG